MLGSSTLSNHPNYCSLSRDIPGYLRDLAMIAHVRDNTAGDYTIKELFSLSHDVYISTHTWSVACNKVYSTLTANSFGLAACWPRLNRYSIPMIQKQCIGGSSRSAILLTAAHSGVTCLCLLRDFVLGFSEVDVNLECPLIRLPVRYVQGAKMRN